MTDYEKSKHYIFGSYVYDLIKNHSKKTVINMRDILEYFLSTDVYHLKKNNTVWSYVQFKNVKFEHIGGGGLIIIL